MWSPNPGFCSDGTGEGSPAPRSKDCYRQRNDIGSLFTTLRWEIHLTRIR